MILRSLSHAIRRQDWFTVLIEFLILVIGIFVGLQVNNWNEIHLRFLKKGCKRFLST